MRTIKVIFCVLGLAGVWTLAQAQDPVQRSSRKGGGGASFNLNRKLPVFLGVGFRAVPDFLASHLQLPQGTGFLVLNVVPQSPAAKAGVMPHDVLVSLNSKKLRSAKELDRQLASYRPGDTVLVSLIHRGKTKSVPLTLAASAKRMPQVPWRVPSSQWRGKLILHGPKGQQTHLGFSNPLDTPDRANQTAHDLWQKAHVLWGLSDKDPAQKMLALRVNKLFSSLHTDFKDELKFQGGGVAMPITIMATDRASHLVWISPPYEVRVKGVGKERTITLIKNNTVVHDNLPWAKRDMLPKNIKNKLSSLFSK